MTRSMLGWLTVPIEQPTTPYAMSVIEMLCVSVTFAPDRTTGTHRDRLVDPLAGTCRDRVLIGDVREEQFGIHALACGPITPALIYPNESPDLRNHEISCATTSFRTMRRAHMPAVSQHSARSTTKPKPTKAIRQSQRKPRHSGQIDRATVAGRCEPQAGDTLGDVDNIGVPHQI